MVSDRIPQKAVTLLWCLALLVFLILAFFNHPSLDDYIYAVLLRDHGLSVSQSFWWNEWSGRYFSNLLISLNPLSFQSIIAYKIVTFLLIAVFFGGLFYGLSKAFGMFREKSERYFAAAIGSLLLILTLPAFSEGFYWMAAAITYQGAAIMSMILILVAVRMTKAGISRRKALILFGAGVLLCAAIAGSNEISMLSQLYVLLVVCIYRAWHDKRIPLYFSGWLLVSGICAGIVILAPGNAVRSSQFNHMMGMGGLIAHSALSTLSFLWRILIPFCFAGMVLLLMSLRQSGTKDHQPEKPAFYLHPLISLGILLVLVFLLFLSGWYSTNSHLPARSENVVYFWTFAGWIWIIRNTSFLLTSKIKKLPGPKIAKILMYSFLFLFLLLFVRENSLRSGIGDLALRRAFSYERQMQERYRILKDTTQENCVIPAISPRPALLFIGDVDAPEFSAQYDALCQYYHKKSITIKPLP
jgi:hypothetical protein